MVLPANLPMVEPQWQKRRISAAEVLRLARNEDVPGVNPGDPQVIALRQARLGNVARIDLSDALRRGFLYVRERYGLHDSDDQRSSLRLVWLC